MKIVLNLILFCYGCINNLCPQLLAASGLISVREKKLQGFLKILLLVRTCYYHAWSVLSVFCTVRGVELAFVTIYLAEPTVFSTELAIRLAWPTFQKAVFWSLSCGVGRLKNKRLMQGNKLMSVLHLHTCNSIKLQISFDTVNREGKKVSASL